MICVNRMRCTQIFVSNKVIVYSQAGRRWGGTDVTRSALLSLCGLRGTSLNSLVCLFQKECGSSI